MNDLGQTKFFCYLLGGVKMGEWAKKTKAKRVDIYDIYLILWVIYLKKLQCFSDGLAASDQL